MTRVNRRTFLRVAGVQLGAAAAAGPLRPAPVMARRRAQPGPDVAVIGSGAFGGWTALHLREAGSRVTLVDAYGSGNSRATSGGETRQIRVGYGDREMYSRWILTALDRWKQRETEFGVTLLTETGRLQLSPDWTPSLTATKAVFEKLGVAHEVLTQADLRSRYPQMSPEGVGVALLEPGASVLRARQGCLEVAKAFERKGGRIVIGQAAPGARTGRRLEAIALADDTPIRADTFVFACGPWLPRLFPDLLGRSIATPRREVFFFGTPAGDERFSVPRLPNYSEASYYGFPNLDYRGFKVCPIGEGMDVDPDVEERIVSAYQVRRAREYLALRFPALKDMPVLESRVCQLENTADEHFLIDRHPDYDNVWIAGGGSGHGYKHGPVVGEYIAQRALGQDPHPELASVFRLR